MKVEVSMNFSKILGFGEGTTVEFKESMNEKGYKTISAFSNTDGGLLFCGVSDNGNIVGFDCSDEPVRNITTKIMHKMSIHPSVNCFEWDGKKILKIDIDKSMNPISYNGRYYKRVGSNTTKMLDDELKEFLLRGTNWDGLTGDYSLDEIDDETVKKFMRMAVNIGRLPDDTDDVSEILLRLNLLIDDKLTNAAIILFGKNPQKYFINALVRVLRLKDDISISDRAITGNLFNQVEEAEQAIKNSINVKYEIKGKLTRDEIWEYPLEAIREALLNSIIHRDYFNYGVQTQIKIFDDYIWFFNTGGLFGGLTIDELKRPHPSKTRNPLIADVFSKAGLVEVYGSGIGRMLNSLNDTGLPEPEFSEEFGGFSLYMRKDIYDKEYLKGLGLNDSQIKVIFFLKEHKFITISDFSRISPDVNERTLRRYLSDLIDKDLIIPIGEKRGRKYELSRYRT
jgi:ATP-dependent DNA helicase RecG